MHKDLHWLLPVARIRYIWFVNSLLHMALKASFVGEQIKNVAGCLTRHRYQDYEKTAANHHVIVVDVACDR